jgi:hypothetical protein
MICTHLHWAREKKKLEYLEKHMLARAETASSYAVAPELDDVRSEPRFKEMLKRMNLPRKMSDMLQLVGEDIRLVLLPKTLLCGQTNNLLLSGKNFR